MNSGSVIRTIYLYIFALLGLVLVTIGSVRLVDMALKQFVFTEADREQRFYARQPIMPPFPKEAERLSETEDLTPEERAELRRWLEDYQSWKDENARFDPVLARRQRDAAISLALLAVGLPLYLLHWRIIRREATR